MSETTGFFDETFDAEHLPDPLPADPFALIGAWLDEARAKSALPNPDAMSLATVDAQGRPSSRMVLCKRVLPDRGAVQFYTNYNSRKSRDLEANPRCALLFHWDELGRQIRIEGRVTRAPEKDSDAYFATRSWQSRLGAWASEQSEPIESRSALLEKVASKAMELDLDLSAIVDGRGHELVIPRPPFWGGYRVWAEGVELWCDGAGRVHERARWDRTLEAAGEGFSATAWERSRLQP